MRNKGKKQKQRKRMVKVFFLVVQTRVEDDEEEEEGRNPKVHLVVFWEGWFSSGLCALLEFDRETMRKGRGVLLSRGPSVAGVFVVCSVVGLCCVCFFLVGSKGEQKNNF